MRFPTEEEWEYAASYDPVTSKTRRFPWGEEFPNSKLAVYGIEAWSPKQVGSVRGDSAFGVQDMGGNVWEWTSSKFMPYPGFEAFPYDGYSKDHMKGEHYVCRGGSWATAAPILRCTFRNWYVPTYRQGFLGLRAVNSK
jgi:iron(II)-dependent oxidoreductase